MEKILLEMVRRNRNRKNAKEVSMLVIEGNDWHYYEINAKNPKNGCLYPVDAYVLAVLYKNDSYDGEDEPLYDVIKERIKKHKVTKLSIIISFPGTADVSMPTIKTELSASQYKYIKDCWDYMEKKASEIKDDHRKTGEESALLLTYFVPGSLPFQQDIDNGQAMAVSDDLVGQMEQSTEHENV